MKTTKEMAEEIRERYKSKPDWQISAGIYLEKVGTKYVTILNIWDTTRFEKILISEFYEIYMYK